MFHNDKKAWKDDDIILAILTFLAHNNWKYAYINDKHAKTQQRLETEEPELFYLMTSFLGILTIKLKNTTTYRKFESFYDKLNHIFEDLGLRTFSDSQKNMWQTILKIYKENNISSDLSCRMFMMYAMYKKIIEEFTPVTPEQIEITRSYIFGDQKEFLIEKCRNQGFVELIRFLKSTSCCNTTSSNLENSDMERSLLDDIRSVNNETHLQQPSTYEQEDSEMKSEADDFGLLRPFNISSFFNSSFQDLDSSSVTSINLNEDFPLFESNENVTSFNFFWTSNSHQIDDEIASPEN